MLNFKEKVHTSLCGDEGAETEKRNELKLDQETEKRERSYTRSGSASIQTLVLNGYILSVQSSFEKEDALRIMACSDSF